MRTIGLSLICLITAGCGSSGSNSDPLTRAEMAANLEAALGRENVSNPADLPRSGVVQFAGYSTLGLPTGDVVGDLEINVNFGRTTTPISGEMSNFDGMTGSLTVDGGFIDRQTDTDVDYTFGADFGGTLADTNGTYTLDGTLAGDFRGRFQDGITGQIFGDIDGPDGQSLFDGTIAATRVE